MGEEKESLSPRLTDCTFTDGMDLDTPAELMTAPDVSQMSLHNTSTDVFTLLISQVQQCHTQKVAELQQKIVLLKRKCRKLEDLVKGRGEIALKYRQTCVKLREENRELKRLITEQPSPHEISLSMVPRGKKATLCDKDQHSSPPDVTESSQNAVGVAPENSKKGRLARRRGPKKVRYAESVTSPEEVSLHQRLKLKASIEDKLLVPETMDPDLYVDELDDFRSDPGGKYPLTASSQLSPEDDVTQGKNDRRSQVAWSDDKSLDAKENWQPKQNSLNSAAGNPRPHVDPSLIKQGAFKDDAASESSGLPQDASTPVFSPTKVKRHSRIAELSPVILEGLDDTFDREKNSATENTEMSPTFAKPRPVLVGHQTSPYAALSPGDRFNGTSESEASHLLLPQKTSPLISGRPTSLASAHKLTHSFHSPAGCPQNLKRKISPLGRRPKLARLAQSDQSGSGAGVRGGLVSRSDRGVSKDQAKFHQSTLSQHFGQLSDSKRSVTFKVPVVPCKDNNLRFICNRSVKSPDSTSGESFDDEIGTSPGGGVDRRLPKDESLNGSMDPVVDLDDYEEEQRPGPQENPILPTGSGLEADPGGAEGDPGNAEESRDRSDVMFEESTDYELEDLVPVSVKTRPVEGMEDFDRVPRNDNGPKYKHREVVRKHDERDKLKGFDCKQCAEFYGGMGLTDTQKEDRMKACSRHRGRYTPPSTPEHYWSIDFPDTPTCVKRGYIREDDNSKVDDQVMPRRRNKLKQLFKK